jgi:arginase
MGDRLTGLAVPEPHTPIDPSLPDGSQQDRMAALYLHLANAVADDQAPVVWAGDCVSSIGVLAGLQQRGVEPTLIWIDAHGDFNTWQTTPSGFIGGMPLAMIVGRGEQTIVEGAGMRTIDETAVVLVDGRDLDSAESTAVTGSAMTVLSVDDVSGWTPPRGKLYVHVDADVVDPTDMPAMNYAAPNGPTLAAVRSALGCLAATGRVAAFSMSVWNPELAGAAEAARACATLAEPFST